MFRVFSLAFLFWISAFHSIAATIPPMDKRLSNLNYPFAVDTYHFTSQGKALDMAYMYLPPKENKPVVTLLHGKNFNGAYWQQTAEFLQDNGYGVLIPDQIGFGKSSKPTDYQYSFAALASNTRELLEKLDIDQSVIVGHSMGGMLATRFALLFPEHTAKLVLVNPIGLENYLLYESYPDIETAFQRELNKKPENIVTYQQKNYYDGKWNDDYASHAAFLQGWIKGDDWPQLAKVAALTYDMILTQPVIEDFQYLKVPSTLIIGTRDRTAPGRASKRETVTRELGRYDKLGAEVKQRNSTLFVVELEGLGHLPQIEDFATFKVPFLKAVELAPAL